jgi:glucosamine--fructose-6-phosphate aminotransferase (isomerizing)
VLYRILDEILAGLPVEVDIASEFRYREPPLSPRSWALFVSQSGETADTLAALRYCRGKVDRIVSVVNVPTSSIARESDLALPIMAGVEVGVASTKAFTCQLLVLGLLALKAARDRGRLDDNGLAHHLTSLRLLPGLMNHALGLARDVAIIAEDLARAQDVLFLGRGAMFPMALEGALKLKEISYIHAEGYASGELKHGPIALIDAAVPVIVMAPRDALFDKTVSNMQEVMARHGRVLLISDAQGVAEAGHGVWRSLTLPRWTRPLPPSFTPSRCSFWPIIPRSPRAPMWTSRAIWPNPLRWNDRHRPAPARGAGRSSEGRRNGCLSQGPAPLPWRVRPAGRGTRRRMARRSQP